MTETVADDASPNGTALSPATLSALRAVDTPTVCNALEVVTGGRSASGFTRGTPVCVDPDLPPVVGFARTAVIRAASPATEPPATVRERRLAYYRHVAGPAGPNVAVIQDTDWPHPIGAFWGEVNVAIHRGLGVAGVVTSGLIRDLGDLDGGFQIVAGGVGPSHAFVHVTELGGTVDVMGMRVREGDVIHADRHGAVAFAPAIARELPAAIDLVARREAPILRAARAPGFDLDALYRAWGEADDVH